MSIPQPNSGLDPRAALERIKRLLNSAETGDELIQQVYETAADALKALAHQPPAPNPIREDLVRLAAAYLDATHRLAEAEANFNAAADARFEAHQLQDTAYDALVQATGALGPDLSVLAHILLGDEQKNDRCQLTKAGREALAGSKGKEGESA